MFKFFTLEIIPSCKFITFTSSCLKVLLWRVICVAILRKLFGARSGQEETNVSKRNRQWVPREVNKDILLVNPLVYWLEEGERESIQQGGNLGPVVCVNIRANADRELTGVRRGPQPFPIIVSFNPTYEKALLLSSFYRRENGDMEH